MDKRTFNEDRLLPLWYEHIKQAHDALIAAKATPELRKQVYVDFLKKMKQINTHYKGYFKTPAHKWLLIGSPIMYITLYKKLKKRPLKEQTTGNTSAGLSAAVYKPLPVFKKQIYPIYLYLTVKHLVKSLENNRNQEVDRLLYNYGKTLKNAYKLLVQGGVSR